MAKARKTKAKAGKPAAAAPRGALPWRVLKWTAAKTLKWGTVACVWGAIALIALSAWYATDLPDVDEAFAATRRPTVTLIAADGTEIAAIGDVYGVRARLQDLPKALPQAVLATEDRRFYDHFGLDVIGLARAMVANVRAGRIVQGGSTITQQVAKNLFLTPERTIKRKIQEVMLALWLEHKFTKDEILTIYLNRVYLGAGTYGVDAAAGKYFGRPAKDLTAYQSAMVAGLLKAPSRYNPIANPEKARARTAQVLRNMVAAGYLSQAAAKRAGSRPAPGPARAGAGPGIRLSRHFTDWVLEQVADFVNAGDRDLVVETTLDPSLQRLAQGAVEETLARSGAKRNISEAALVAMTPSGAVRAMIGGRRYAESQFNRATQARRQPGSAFKPFVYLAALEAGMGPDTRFTDGPLDIGGWRPRNFDNTYAGPVTMTEALARSMNTVAVRAAERAGRGNVIATARRLGLGGALTATPSLALGVGEVTLLDLTQAYGPFANGGAGVWAHGITEIRDGAGKVLYRRRGSGPGRVVTEGHVQAMNRMLGAAVAHGTGKRAAIGRPQAGKTGTSQNFRDAWYVGYTADLVAGVWMGNDDGAPMRGVTGGGAPARLWRQFMKSAHAGLPLRPLPGLVAAPGTGPAPVPDRNPEGGGPGFWSDFITKLTRGAG